MNEKMDRIACIAEDSELIRQAEDGDVIPVGMPQVGDLMDLAVARSVGLKSVVLYQGKALISSRDWDELRGIEHPTCEGDVACVPFQPSTDLNAAFAAAEKAGLFADGSMYITQDTHGEWWVGQWGTSKALERSMALPFAICASILKLKQ